MISSDQSRTLSSIFSSQSFFKVFQKLKVFIFICKSCKSSVQAFRVQAIFSLASHIGLTYSDKNGEEKGDKGVFIIHPEKILLVYRMYAHHLTKSSNFIFINRGKAHHLPHFYKSTPPNGVK